MKHPILEKYRSLIDPSEKADIDTMFALANQIADILKRKSMTQRVLAAKLGEKEAEVCKWLSGSHNFTVSTLNRISAVLGEPIFVIPGVQVGI